MTHTLATPKFTGTGLPAVIPANGDATLNVSSVAGGDVASPSQTGFLLMYRDASDVTRFNSRNETDLVQVKSEVAPRRRRSRPSLVTNERGPRERPSLTFSAPAVLYARCPGRCSRAAATG